MVGITNINFAKTVAVSMNEAGPFALRNSIMDDRDYGTFSSMHFQNSKLRFKMFPVHSGALARETRQRSTMGKEMN